MTVTLPGESSYSHESSRSEHEERVRFQKFLQRKEEALGEEQVPVFESMIDTVGRILTNEGLLGDIDDYGVIDMAYYMTRYGDTFTAETVIDIATKISIAQNRTTALNEIFEQDETAEFEQFSGGVNFMEETDEFEQANVA